MNVPAPVRDVVLKNFLRLSFSILTSLQAYTAFPDLLPENSEMVSTGKKALLSTVVGALTRNR
jgi:hypothetical protein